MIDIFSGRTLAAGLTIVAGLATTIMSGFIVALELRGQSYYVPMPRWLLSLTWPFFRHPWPALAIGLALIVGGIVFLVRR